MGILTVILTVIAQLVLRFSIVSPLKKAITEQERIESELALGANIQQSALPENVTVHFGEDDDVSVYGIMKPAKETGGDFFDHVLLDEDHLMLTIADVSGKGVPAALFMMMSKIFIDVYADQGLLPGKALEMANDAICSRNREHMFVTVWLGILEISTGHIVAANAGHQKPVIRKAGGDFAIYDDPHGFVCGRFRKMKYESYELDLEKGDTLFVYTDGLTEAADPDKKLLGVDGMLKALNELPREASPEEVCHHMQKAVEDHAKGIPQSDDLTMLCLKADN
jgi:sigma-B regulation protein RsbU (phosphoserine phosphatase)